jgi:DNA-binding CsgD family transcriptional regulator
MAGLISSLVYLRARGVDRRPLADAEHGKRFCWPAVGTRAEIVALLAGGATDAQIAGRLFLSVNTARSRLERIRDKTGARRRTELVRYAIQAGIGPVAPPT